MFPSVKSVKSKKYCSYHFHLINTIFNQKKKKLYHVPTSKPCMPVISGLSLFCCWILIHGSSHGTQSWQQTHFFSMRKRTMALLSKILHAKFLSAFSVGVFLLFLQDTYKPQS